MSKIMMAAAFGAGYVLGAKAGRERYDTLSEKAQELWGNPKVQEQTSKVQEQASKVQEAAKGKLAGAKDDESTDTFGAGKDSVLAGSKTQDSRG